MNELLAARNFTHSIVIDLPADYAHPTLKFRTSELARLDSPAACINPNVNLSTKRNLGLLLARMLGWERIFFLDDDIRDLNSSDLYATASMLGPYHAVGMRAVDFPDNSVVCHGHRKTGGNQDVFISGSVLAVDCGEPVAFFPEIYNEDWFFFYHYAAERRLAWSGRDATQLCYDPFADPQRAAGQEFGDVMAEGLFSLLHHRIGEDDATGAYWKVFLNARMRFLEGVLARAEAVEPYLRIRIVSSVVTAMARSSQISPSMCEHYVELWKKDLGDWQQNLKRISRKSSVKAALSELSLAASGRSPYVLAGIFGGRGGGASRYVTAGQGLALSSSVSGVGGRIDSIVAPQRLDATTTSYLPIVTDWRLDGREDEIVGTGVVSRIGMRADEPVRRVVVSEERSEPVDSSRKWESDRATPGKHRKSSEPGYDEPPVNAAHAFTRHQPFLAHMSADYVPMPSAARSVAGR